MGVVTWVRTASLLSLHLLCVICSSVGTDIKIGVIVQTGAWENISGVVTSISERFYNDLSFDVRKIDDECFIAHDIMCSHLSKSDVIIAIGNCKTARCLGLQSTYLGVPLMLIVNETCKLVNNEFTVTFNSHYGTVGSLARDLIPHMEWKNVLLIYDDSMDYLQVNAFITYASKTYTNVRTLRLGSLHGPTIKATLADTLTNIAELRLPCFVYLDTNKTLVLLQTVVDEGLDDWRFFWIILFSEFTVPHVFDAKNIHIANIVFVIRNTTKENDNSTSSKQLILMQNTTFLERTIVDGVAISKYAILLERGENTTSTGNMSEVTNRRKQKVAGNIRNVELEGLIGTVSFCDEGYLKDIRYSITVPDHDVPDSVKTVGSWSVSMGLRLYENCAFSNRFYNFKNTTLLIGAKQNLPFVDKVKEDDKIKWIGFCIDILDQLSSTLSFRYTIVEPDDNLWGAQNPDGSWNGIIGDVVNERINFGIGPFTITSQRSKVIDFTKPFLEDGVGIISRKPDEDSEKMVKMFQPFRPKVWGIIAATVCVVGVCLGVASRFSPITAYNRGLEGSSEQEVKFGSNLWLVFGAFMQQGGGPKPSSGSGRFILGCFWLFTILMASTFTANLVAFLTVSITKKPINSLAELAGQNKIEPIVTFGSNLYSLFKESRVPIYNTIWQSLKSMPRLHGLDNYLSLVRSGDYAFMGDKLTLEYVMLNDCETYALADDVFNTGSYGFVLPKNAPFKDVFDRHIIKMQETGLMIKWKKKWWKNVGSCTRKLKTNGAKMLDLESLAGPFLIYIGICVGASIILLIEMLISLKQKKKCDKKTNSVKKQ